MPSPEASSRPRTIPQISPALVRAADQVRDQFVHAQPCQHAMVDGFFDPRLALNEMGQVGGKAANTKIREISPACKELYELIGSAPFLDLMSRVTGIPDLLMDPKLYGGGAHDNQHGQELDAHVDFNYDESQQLHRRLNLIVYMNKEWEIEWGGAIEIHSNPRQPETNQIRAFNPLLNRAILFETNEISWHGFPKINLPPNKRHLSRKSISIYLYTKIRPEEEIVPMHDTFYVQRPLPEHIQAGYTIAGVDVEALKSLMTRRDDWLVMFHKMELAKNAEIAAKIKAIENLSSHVHVPLTGYVSQVGQARGIHPDHWVASHAEFEINPLAPVSSILLRGWRPDQAPPAKNRMRSGSASTELALGGGTFEVTLKLPQSAAAPFSLNIDTESQGRAVDASVDSRDLAFRVSEVRAKHPLVQTLTKMLG